VQLEQAEQRKTTLLLKMLNKCLNSVNRRRRCANGAASHMFYLWKHASCPSASPGVDCARFCVGVPYVEGIGQGLGQVCDARKVPRCNGRARAAADVARPAGACDCVSSVTVIL
jgi:hypothetical protein